MEATATDARTRILTAAYDLFSRRGIRGVGIDAIIRQSGVARMTLYRHFASKEALALAYLERREQQWTRHWLQAEVQRRAADPRERLLAIFDVFDEWFHQTSFEGCSFINVMLETADDRDSIYRASIAYLAGIRSFLEQLARDAGIAEAEDFARKWHILMKGSIVAAGEGDQEAAKRAQEMGRLLLDDEGPARAGPS
ncbi:TetR/AcrR family transcriptional regulator [soil metagenome]|jgi:AcrR family transcriptional regulator